MYLDMNVEATNQQSRLFIGDAKYCRLYILIVYVCLLPERHTNALSINIAIIAKSSANYELRKHEDQNLKALHCTEPNFFADDTRNSLSKGQTICLQS